MSLTPFERSLLHLYAKALNERREHAEALERAPSLSPSGDRSAYEAAHEVVHHLAEAGRAHKRLREARERAAHAGRGA